MAKAFSTGPDPETSIRTSPTASEGTVFSCEPPLTASQLAEFLLLRPGQPCRAALVISIGLHHLVTQTRPLTLVGRDGVDLFRIEQ
jgi:hypothetical protein